MGGRTPDAPPLDPPMYTMFLTRALGIQPLSLTDCCGFGE